MMKLLCALALLLSPLAASAPMAAAEPRPADVVSQSHMHIQAGKDVLFGYAKTPEQFAEASAYWAEVLRSAGIEPGAARVLNLEYALPTYSILYLVKPEALREHEAQLRVLKPGDDIDAGLIRASGVSVVQKPSPWLLVYIGPELGYVGLIAKTAEDLSVRLEKRKALLVAAGKKIIGHALVAVDHDEYKFGAELLFFQ